MRRCLLVTFCGCSKVIVLSGSYDKTVKLFDVRTKASVLTMNHNAHVESVLIHPSGGLVISAGRKRVIGYC